MSQRFLFARTRRRFWLSALLLVALLAGIPACRVTDWQLWNPPPPGKDAYSVVKIRDVYYGDGLEEDSSRSRLDVFIPGGKRDFPVVVLVHGGAWMSGDNRCCGLYSSVGEYLASQGIAAVLPNYRLSPGVKHPEHIKDLAKAFAWTKANIAEFGGDARQLFLVGHSAGGHLVTLLATDDSWLKAEGYSSKDIRGVVSISGVYHIPPEAETYALGGSERLSFRWKQIIPLRGSSGERSAPFLPGIPLKVNVFGPAFGDDPLMRELASPVCHVRPGLPPFLLLCAENDLPSLSGMAQEFHKALKDQGCESNLYMVPKRNHNSVMFQAIDPRDPVGAAITEFVRQRPN